MLHSYYGSLKKLRKGRNWCVCPYSFYGKKVKMGKKKKQSQNLGTVQKRFANSNVIFPYFDSNF